MEEYRRLQNEERRWARIQHVQILYEEGFSVSAIRRKLDLSRGTVYADLRQQKRPNHQRASPYQQYRPLVRSLLLENQTSKQIEQTCRSKGYTGSLATLNTMIAEERRNIAPFKSKTYLFRQKIIHVISDFKEGEHIKRMHQLHPKLLEAFPTIKEIDKLVQTFRNLYIEKTSEYLEGWIEKYEQIKLPYAQAFIHGIQQDIKAFKLSIQEHWSNDPVEGHVNRLEIIKRMMYGRASFLVLKNWVLYQF